LPEAVAVRDRLLRGELQPAALDMLNPAGARMAGLDGFVVLAQAGGSEAVMERYTSELSGAERIDGLAEADLWKRLREFTPEFLAARPDGAVVRVSTTIGGVPEVLSATETPALARAGNGVVYSYFEDCNRACEWAAEAGGKGMQPVVEYVAESGCSGERWPIAGSDLTLMEKIKQMFDPAGLLNKGRLYGRL
jgi:FAD/FMN-containing dehydrogenase